MKYYRIYARRTNNYTYTKLGKDNCFKSLDEAFNQIHKLYNEWNQYGWAFVIVEEGEQSREEIRCANRRYNKK